VKDPDAAAVTLASLKELGVSVALDDFGTGFSSLSYLSRFPVDLLKIDKSFIDALAGGTRGDEEALVDAMIEMSNRLRLQVTAEGIEHQIQADRLVAMGCTSGQGFHFARPMTNEQLLQAVIDPAAGEAVAGAPAGLL
jgi:EAL domain-containing protein (putative c-di-GMP-specific phosphodiesterase class I)